MPIALCHTDDCRPDCPSHRTTSHIRVGTLLEREIPEIQAIECDGMRYIALGCNSTQYRSIKYTFSTYTQSVAEQCKRTYDLTDRRPLQMNVKFPAGTVLQGTVCVDGGPVMHTTQYQCTDSDSRRIPRVIYQTWPTAPYPRCMVDTVKEMMALNPRYRLRFFSDGTLITAYSPLPQLH